MITLETLLVCNLIVSVYLAYKTYELAKDVNNLYQGLATVMIKLNMTDDLEDDD
jgi:hypothetical protein